MTIEEALQRRLAANVLSTEEIDDDAQGNELITIAKFSGSSRQLTVHEALQVQQGCIVFCRKDGVIARRTDSAADVGNPKLEDLWDFYGDVTGKMSIKWDKTLQIPEDAEDM